MKSIVKILRFMVAYALGTCFVHGVYDSQALAASKSSAKTKHIMKAPGPTDGGCETDGLNL